MTVTNGTLPSIPEDQLIGAMGTGETNLLSTLEHVAESAHPIPDSEDARIPMLVIEQVKQVIREAKQG